jgi:hypothetical protein
MSHTLLPDNRDSTALSTAPQDASLTGLTNGSPAASNPRLEGFELPNACGQPGRGMALECHDGSTYFGTSFGAETGIPGELVFQTGMVGYPESIQVRYIFPSN